MALTTTFSLTSTYQQIASDGEDFTAQSRSNDNVEVIYGTAPADTENGHIIKYLEGVSSAVFGQGDVWAKTSKNAIVVVTK